MKLTDWRGEGVAHDSDSCSGGRPPPPTDIQTTVAEAVAAERRYLARELHDGAVQSLWSLGAEIQQLERALASPGELAARLEALRGTWALVYEELRQTITQLHEALPPGEALVPAVERALARLERDLGVTTHLELPAHADFELDGGREAQLVRVCQAALANVRRHSRARHVVVRLRADEQGISLVVIDDGVGFEPGRVGRRATDHFGLTMMRERLDALGGRLDLDSAPGQGTRLAVWIPRQAPAPPA